MESKQIKDYLHLYLAAKCLVEKSDYHMVHNWMIHAGDITVIDGSLIKHVHNVVDFKGVIKPILRPLSDMTEEDCPEWFKEWMPDGFSVFHQVDNTYKYVQIDSEANDGYCLTIHPDGSMSCQCKDNGDQYAYKGAELFRHLLLKRFDLFNLIAEGLAISSTTK